MTTNEGKRKMTTLKQDEEIVAVDGETEIVSKPQTKTGDGKGHDHYYVQTPDGEFGTYVDAANELGIPYHIIRMRCTSGSAEWQNWRLVPSAGTRFEPKVRVNTGLNLSKGSGYHTYHTPAGTFNGMVAAAEASSHHQEPPPGA